MTASAAPLAALAEDYVAVSSDGRKTEGPFTAYHEAKTRADKMGGYVKFLAEEQAPEVVNGSADRLTDVQHAAARREAYHLERDATFVHEYLARTNRVDLVRPHVEQVMVRCEAIRKVAEGKLGEEDPTATAARDFDSIEAAVKHEMAVGAVGSGDVGGGVYIFYPGGLGRRVYYASGKYHIARRAEPMAKPIAAEEDHSRKWTVYYDLSGETGHGKYAVVVESDSAEGALKAAKSEAKRRDFAVFSVEPGDRLKVGKPMSKQEIAAMWARVQKTRKDQRKRAEVAPRDARGRFKDDPPVVAQELAVVERDVKAVRAGRKKAPLTNAETIHLFVKKELVGYSQEVVLVIPLDLRGHPLNPKPYVVAMGQRAEVTVKVEDVLRPVLETNAAGFVVVHNHPSGKANPSKSDKELTLQIKEAAAAACPGVPLLDHVIEADGQYYSFANGTIYEDK
jgi:RadC-like JAB domain